jgi:hypothetical protein
MVVVAWEWLCGVCMWWWWHAKGCSDKPMVVVHASGFAVIVCGSGGKPRAAVKSQWLYWHASCCAVLVCGNGGGMLRAIVTNNWLRWHASGCAVHVCMLRWAECWCFSVGECWCFSDKPVVVVARQWLCVVHVW